MLIPHIIHSFFGPFFTCLFFHLLLCLTSQNTDLFNPLEICPFAQAAPHYNNVDEIINRPRGQLAPVTRTSYTSSKYDWAPEP